MHDIGVGIAIHWSLVPWTVFKSKRVGPIVKGLPYFPPNVLDTVVCVPHDLDNNFAQALKFKFKV